MSAVSSVSPLTFIFFHRLISEVVLLIAPEFDTCSVVTLIYKIRSEIWGPVPKKIWRPKNSKFGPNFGQLLMVNISEMQQYIIEWQMALQTAVSPALVYLSW